MAPSRRGESAVQDGEERTFWQDSSEDLGLRSPGTNFHARTGAAQAYSGTESAISFPLTTLTNRYRLSLKIIVSSFSPSVTVKTSCPIIPSYFANSDRFP